MKITSFINSSIVSAVAILSFPACITDSNLNNNLPVDAAWVNPDCDLVGDDDGDGILNHHEGCQFLTDNDGDTIPDYLDLDSDNDGVPDRIEAGDEHLSTPPKDYDGDGIPDFRDTDSDNDGVLDGDEDRDGNGIVGICAVYCPNLDPDECGAGQACLATGRCHPTVTFECSQGETDRLNADTDGDGIPDGQEGTVVCNESSESNPNGRRPVQFYNTQKFKIGVEIDALVTEQIIEAHGTETCTGGVDDDADGYVDCEDPDCHNTTTCDGVSVTFDLEDPAGMAAGFAVTRVPKASSVEEENTLIVQEISAAFGASSVTMRASGSPLMSHDDQPTIARAMIDITGISAKYLSELRNTVLTTLTGRRSNEYLNLPGPDAFGGQSSNFILSYTVQRRTPMAGGIQTGDPYIVIMGAIGTSADYSDTIRRTGFVVDDAANGSNLAGPGDAYEGECEVYLVATQPTADIIWVIDESGSMYEEQQSVSTNAVNFFNRALSYGLDFRMGIVGVGIEGNGVFCTADGQSNDHFLTSGNLTQFQACILEPWGSGTSEGGTEHGITQGYNAIVNHLPRDNQPNRIRPDAQLVIIYVSDERAQELKDSCGAGEGSGSATIAPACMQQVIGPTVNLLLGVSNPEGVGRAHAIVGPPPSGCSTASQVGQGYVEIANATGGQVASICQADLGSTLQIIIEDIVASSSPVVLHHYPISVSVAVAKDGIPLRRSRQDGFDYRSSANTVVFVNQHFDPLHESEVVVSYLRWVNDVNPPD